MGQKLLIWVRSIFSIIWWWSEAATRDALQKICSKIFSNIHRKILVLESFFDKVPGLQVYNFIKKRLQHRYFVVNNAKFLRTVLLKNIYEWLILDDSHSLASCTLLWKFVYLESIKILVTRRMFAIFPHQGLTRHTG